MARVGYPRPKSDRQAARRVVARLEALSTARGVWLRIAADAAIRASARLHASENAARIEREIAALRIPGVRHV